MSWLALHKADHTPKEVKQLIFDVVILLLKMAVLDGAEAILNTRVRAPRHSLTLGFKQEKLSVPICRQPISTSAGMSTHEMRPSLFS